MGYGIVNVPSGGGSAEKVQTLETEVSQLKTEVAGKAAAADLTAHTKNRNNPHGVTAEQVGARPKNWMPKLPDVAFLGSNPVQSTADDTTDRWAVLGSGYAWYCEDGKLNDQPSTYGILLNYCYGSDVFQLWHCQNSGPLYARSGNAGGWSGSWKKLIDSSSIGSQNVNYAAYAALSNYDQDYGARLRNQALVAADTTPGANGQIFWTYG